MSQMYEQVVTTLSRPPEMRTTRLARKLTPFFRRKSQLFQDIKEEPLMDVIKHCDFLNVRMNHTVVTQGQKGNSFFIILRGSASVFIQEAFIEDSSPDNRIRDVRASLGCQVGRLAEGATFGEQALINDDCVRTASVITNEETDLICISRDLYNRCLANVVHVELEEKMNFVESHPLFCTWSNKWKKSLAIGLVKEVINYDEVVARQGDSPDNVYFVISGELRVVLEPDTHEDQLGPFMRECSLLYDDEEKAGITGEFFALANWVSAKSRAAQRLRSAPGGSALDFKVASVDLPEFKLNFSPSDVRKMAAEAKASAPKHNVCYLERGHAFGDLEQLLRLDAYHASAVTTQQTTILRMHRVVFDKLIRKKNQETLKDLARHLGILFYKRMARTGLIDKVPLLSYINMRLEHLNGQRQARRKVKEDEGDSPWDDSTRPKSRHHEPVNAMYWHKGSNRTPTKDASLPTVTQNKYSRLAQLCDSGDTHNRPSMHGIFLKLMKMADPMVTRKDMDVDEDEYNYLLQLKRRLAKRMEEFQPGPIANSDDAVVRKRLAREDKNSDALPSIGQNQPDGHRGRSRKPSQSYNVRKRQDRHRKSVGFALPRC